MNLNRELAQLTDILELLAARLERLSADSTFAHRASGIRGNILRTLDEFCSSPEEISEVDLYLATQLSDQAFDILIAAAREIA